VNRTATSGFSNEPRDVLTNPSTVYIGKNSGSQGNLEEIYSQGLKENVNGAIVINGYGVSGADGKSAYELAVENGFTGTVEELLDSLKGESGSSVDPSVITDAVNDYLDEHPVSGADVPTTDIYFSNWEGGIN
jgi:hypothetical protein